MAFYNEPESSVKPALTAEEWKAQRWERASGQPMIVETHGGAGVEIMDISSSEGLEWQLFNAERHPIAALALYGQGFGFSHEDVELLDEVIYQIHGPKMDALHPGVERHLDDLCERIKALLPLEKEGL